MLNERRHDRGNLFDRCVLEVSAHDPDEDTLQVAVEAIRDQGA